MERTNNEHGILDDVFKAAVEQLRQQKDPFTDRASMADQLIREALDAFTDQESLIDLRDWVKTAQTYLQGANHGGV